MSEENKSSTKYVLVESVSKSEEDEIDLLELIRTLLKTWKVIAGITIICTGLALFYALSGGKFFWTSQILWLDLRSTFL